MRACRCKPNKLHNTKRRAVGSSIRLPWDLIFFGLSHFSLSLSRNCVGFVNTRLHCLGIPDNGFVYSLAGVCFVWSRGLHRDQDWMLGPWEGENVNDLYVLNEAHLADGWGGTLGPMKK